MMSGPARLWWNHRAMLPVAVCVLAGVSLAAAIVWPITYLIASHDIGTITGAAGPKLAVHAGCRTADRHPRQDTRDQHPLTRRLAEDCLRRLDGVRRRRQLAAGRQRCLTRPDRSNDLQSRGLQKA